MAKSKITRFLDRIHVPEEFRGQVVEVAEHIDPKTRKRTVYSPNGDHLPHTGDEAIQGRAVGLQPGEINKPVTMEDFHQIQRAALGIEQSGPSQEAQMQKLLEGKGFRPVPELDKITKFNSEVANQVYASWNSLFGANHLEDLKDGNPLVTLFGDGDADGFLAIAGLYRTLKEINKNVNIHVNIIDQARQEDRDYYRSDAFVNDLIANPEGYGKVFVLDISTPELTSAIVKGSIDAVINDHHNGVLPDENKRLVIIPDKVRLNGRETGYCTAELVRAGIELAGIDSKKQRNCGGNYDFDLKLKQGINHNSDLTLADLIAAYSEIATYCDDAYSLIKEKIQGEELISSWSVYAGLMLSKFVTGIAKQVRKNNGTFEDALDWVDKYIRTYAEKSKMQYSLKRAGGAPMSFGSLLAERLEVENELRKQFKNQEPEYVKAAWESVRIDSIVDAVFYSNQEGITGLDEALKSKGSVISPGMHFVLIHNALYDPTKEDGIGEKLKSNVETGIIASGLLTPMPWLINSIDNVREDSGEHANQILEVILRHYEATHNKNANGVLGNYSTFVIKSNWDNETLKNCSISSRTGGNVQPYLEANLRSQGIGTEGFGGRERVIGGHMTAEQVEATLEWFLEEGRKFNIPIKCTEIFGDPDRVDTIRILRSTIKLGDDGTISEIYRIGMRVENE